MDDVRRLPVGEDNNGIAVTLDELAREGARRLIAAALQAEADDYVERFTDERGEDGKRLVVRNGRARERRVTVGSGTVAVQAPRINDKRIERVRNRWCSTSQSLHSRLIVDGDRPAASSPSNCSSAGRKSPVDSPRR